MAVVARAPEASGAREQARAVGAWARCVVGSIAVVLVGLICCLEACTVVATAMGWRAEAVLSGSMAPEIEPGDVVLVSPLRPSLVRPGEVIAFRDPAMPRTLVHRVVAVLPNGELRTKGDANAAPDSDPVPARNVLGVARLRIPAVALPFYWAKSGQYGWVALAGTGLVVLLALAVDALCGPGRLARPTHLGGSRLAHRSAHRPRRYPRGRWRHLAVDP